MSTKRNLQLPEPSFPEYELIRDAAPLPELSAGFRSRVMAECSVSIASAARIRRWKVGSTLAAVCALGLIFFLVLPESADPQPIMTEQVEPHPTSPGHDSSLGFPPSSSKMTADLAKPPSSPKSDKSHMNEIVEGLNKRQKMFDADMLPHF